MERCILCGAVDRDQAGALKHEGCCPHFMRGPDAGGDPSEWPTLLEQFEPPVSRRRKLWGARD